LTQSNSFDGRAIAGEIFTSPFELLSGDSIVTTCIYSTVDRSSDLIWGESSIDNEMCFGFIVYTPTVNSMGFCFNDKGMRFVAAYTMAGY
jgi:hypothetical protein